MPGKTVWLLLLEEPGVFSRVVLQVSVLDDYRVSCNSSQTGADRRALSQIALVEENAQMACTRRSMMGNEIGRVS